MSFIDAHQGKPPSRPSAWRFFPLAMILSLGLVVAVNGVLAYDALSTFPGDAVEDDFGTSNHYDKVLAKAERQAALGWAIDARAEEGRPVLVLKDKAGAPLHATVTAIAQRPLGALQTEHPVFAAAEDGTYRATEALSTPGQWQLLLRVVADGQVMTATRRVIVH